ncbi:MAG: RHS repeat-associated core domain-containing protein, partial [Thermoanaerobaculia bacterium]
GRLGDFSYPKPHVGPFDFVTSDEPLAFEGLNWETAPGEWETGFVYMRNRYYDPELGRFISVDPMGYIDGPSAYQFALNSPFGNRDPMGEVTILVHGVNTSAPWYQRASQGLESFEKSQGIAHQAVIEFEWGDDGSYLRGQQQGGPLTLATDRISEIYDDPDRRYMGEAVNRLRNLISTLKRERARKQSSEPINVIAHSQGTIITLAALEKGAVIDNFIMQGSPLDVLPYKKDNDLERARTGIRGGIFNYWSKDDPAAYVKGGIGRFGDELEATKEFDWITNREFGPGLSVNGFILPSTGEFESYRHSDFMAKAEFFENIHAKDIEQSGDRKLSSDTDLINRLKRLATWP